MLSPSDSYSVTSTRVFTWKIDVYIKVDVDIQIFKDQLFILLISRLILAGMNRLTHLDHDSEPIKLNEKLTLTSTDIRSCSQRG